MKYICGSWFMPKKFRVASNAVSWLLTPIQEKCIQMNWLIYVNAQDCPVQYHTEFYLRTFIDWNHLDDNVVHAVTDDSVRRAVSHWS